MHDEVAQVADGKLRQFDFRLLVRHLAVGDDIGRRQPRHRRGADEQDAQPGDLPAARKLEIANTMTRPNYDVPLGEQPFGQLRHRRDHSPPRNAAPRSPSHCRTRPPKPAASRPMVFPNELTRPVTEPGYSGPDGNRRQDTRTVPRPLSTTLHRISLTKLMQA